MKAHTGATTALILLLAGGGPALAAPPGPGEATRDKETICTDGLDDDGDSLPDCADADCYADPACQPDGSAESTDSRCRDWIDNDRDGATDCDDMDCEGAGVAACKGSWKEVGATAGGGSGATAPAAMPDLGPGMTVDDLIGKGSDADGERNDVLCSDGLDNDGDGRTDCADFGCRFDPSVSVCQGNPGVRFSVVATVNWNHEFEQEKTDTRFSKLQLRALGPIFPIQNSFFLISMRAEKTPRVTFALFQIPIGGGHYLNLNSGGGGLSNQLVVSTSKQLLLDPAFFVFSAFEQGNGASLELGGPIGSGRTFNYRVFGLGGSGRFTGNLGGRFFPDDDDNYSWGGGAQLQVNLVGFISRWDTPFLYTPVPAAVGFFVGGKYEQRARERFPAFNASGTIRYGRFVVLAETYVKRELEFDSWQYSYNIQAGLLLWPKHMMFAADWGEFVASEMKNPPATLPSDLRRQRDERQWRVALHVYFWRNIGIASILYRDREMAPNVGDADPLRERELRIAAQFRF